MTRDTETVLKSDIGRYRCRSTSTRTIWIVRVLKVLRDGQVRVLVICNCPGGTHRRTDDGCSTCHHSIATMERLLANPHEVEELPAPEKGKYECAPPKSRV